MKKLSIYTVALLTLFACKAELPEENIQEPAGGETYLLEAMITPPAETAAKTYLGEKTGTSYPNYWGAGDAVSVNGITSAALPADSQYAGTDKATFELQGILSAPYYYACPASAVSGYSSAHATVTLPSVQEWSGTSYDPAAFIMLGSGSSLPLSFTPLVSVVKLTMPGTYTAKIASVMFEALGNQKVCGPFSTDFSSLTAASGASSRLNAFAPQTGADFGSSVFLVIPAQTYSGGMRFTIRATDGTQMTYGTSSSFQAQAGKVYTLTTKMYAPDAETIPEGMMVMSSNVRFATARDKASDPDTGDRDWTNRKSAYCAMVNALRPAVIGLQEAQKEQVKDIKAGCSGYNHYGLGRERGYNITSDGDIIFGTGNTYAREESTTLLYRTDLITLNSSGTVWHSDNPSSVNSHFSEMADGQSRTSTWAKMTYKPTNTSLYSAAQAKEIQVILNTVSSKNSGNRPVILTGDWNLEESNPIMAPVENAFHSARKTAPQTDYFETYHGWNGKQNRQYDHIFYDGDLASALFCTVNRKWSGIFISDHYPVYAIFDMSGTTPAAGPVADFDLPADPVIGETVTFTDRSGSSAGIASWSWDINGIIYTAQHPQVILSQKNNLITLTVVDRNGERAKVSKSLILGRMTENATHEGYSPVDIL